MTAMTTTHPFIPPGELRAELVSMLREARAAEREIFDALPPVERDAPAADGGWSAKDIQAHLSAWRRHQADRLAALREGHARPAMPAAETDAANAAIHAERVGWTWEQVVADADAATDLLIAEIREAEEATLTQDRTVGTILGNGPEHDLAHLPAVAARVHRSDRVAPRGHGGVLRRAGPVARARPPLPGTTSPATTRWGRLDPRANCSSRPSR